MFFFKGVADYARERASYVVLVELLDIHHRSIILTAEPLAALPHFRSASCLSVSHLVESLGQWGCCLVA